MANKITLREAKASGKYLGINTDGNKKLINGDKVRFIIWNIPAVKTCPYATEHCKAACYALKAEKQYPSCRERRQLNFEATRNSREFIDNMIFTIETELSTKKYTRKYTIFRIHESGDFYNKTYAMAWLEIIRHFEDNKNLVFHAYTKSLPYFEGEKLPTNLAFIASVWDDTKPAMLDMIKKNNYRVYTAVNTFDGYNGYKCRCEDCATCQACMNNNVNHIACEIH